MTRQSKGFSVIELVIILAVVLGAGVGGWYVWQKNQDKEPIKQSSSRSQNKDNQSSQTNTKSDPAEGGKYLVITEWGVRMPLTEGLRGDVKYGVFTFSNGDQAIYFASKKLAAHSSGSACDLVPEADESGQGVSGGTIAVSRSKTKPEVMNQGSFYQPSGYWYTVESGNGGACYQGDTGQEKGTFNMMMQEAINRLEPTNQ